MQELLGDVWPILGAVVLIGILAWAWWTKKQERDRIRSAAEARGWSYRPSDRSLTRRFEGRPFRYGRRGRTPLSGQARVDHRTTAVHVLEGEHRGRPLLAFEYRYRTERPSGTARRTSSGSRRRERVQVTEKHQIVVLGLHQPMPPFFLERRGLFGKAAQAVGVGPEAIGDPEFDERFVVGGVLADQAQEILTRDVRTWLLQEERADRCPVRVEGDGLLTHSRAELTVGRVAKAADFLAELLDRIEPAERRP
ncbi:hypothetical protein Q7C18_03645 [Nesterenkonia sp. CL21]|uniref:hypothetical protein n=1 Tax=Nesterenkonia sp. CL21 TaxID=3064894 RepID=UPI00287A49B3|nr:hypothetical protein [Nesterenkonia sp. CL21]MDS2171781.1 hypothetical protein [Nesterenkonia sp. CL21]